MLSFDLGEPAAGFRISSAATCRRVERHGRHLAVRSDPRRLVDLGLDEVDARPDPMSGDLASRDRAVNRVQVNSEPLGKLDTGEAIRLAHRRLRLGRQR